MAFTLFVAFLGVAVGAGLVARRLMPGPNPAGIAGTILISFVGGLFGGVIGSLAAGVPLAALDGRTLLLAISGTMFALLAYRAFALRWPDEAARKPVAKSYNVRTVVRDKFVGT